MNVWLVCSLKLVHPNDILSSNKTAMVAVLPFYLQVREGGQLLAVPWAILIDFASCAYRYLSTYIG